MKKRVAVLGTGSIGMRHLNVLRSLSEIEPIAIPKRLERKTELEQIGFLTARHLPEAAEMGARLCVVASDTSRHIVDSLAALELEMDLLVEKPMAIDASEARQMNAMAKQKNKKIFVGCVLRFSESLNSFRQYLPEIGSVHSVRIECQSYLPDWRPDRPYQESYSAKAREGGVLRDLIHEIDYAGWIFGWPVSLQAKLRNLGRLNIAAEEVADIFWETKEHCTVSITLDYLSKPARRSMRAYGEKGTLEWDGIENKVTLMLAGQPPRTFSSVQTRDEMFLKQTQMFLNNASQKNEFNLATAAEGIKALAVCDAARLASQSGKTESVC